MVNEKYESDFKGQRLRSNVTNFRAILVFMMRHIPTKLHQFLISSFRDFVRTDRLAHTDRHRQKQYLLVAYAARIKYTWTPA